MVSDETTRGPRGESASLIGAEHKYRLIVENTPVLVSTATMARDPVFTYVSPSHQAVLGYSVDELLGTRVIALAHADDQPRLRQLLAEQLGDVAGVGGGGLATEVGAQAEARLRHADGTWRHFDIVGKSLGGELMFVANDITAQSDARQRLEESEELFKLLFENAPDAYYILDEAGRFLDGNKCAEELVDSTREEFLGKSIFSVGLLHPKHLPRAAANLARNLTGRRTGPDEYLLRRRKGDWINVEVSTYPVVHKKGRMILGIARDITVRKEFEAVLENARDLAESANEAKSSFLADMSHELRTPLNAIIGFSEILLDKEYGEPTPTQAEYLEDIRKSGWHLLNLIDDILDLAKVESGRMELHRGPVSVPSVLQTGVSMVREKAHKHGIALESDLESVPDYLSLDERKVKQVVFNLLSNAVKFTPDGGEVKVQARYFDHAPHPAEGEETMETTGESGILVIEVTDTGIGIAPEFMPSLFEPFVQGEASTGRAPHGTGLGLSLSRRLAELHGGSLTANSDGPDRGSQFTAAFPTWEVSPEDGHE